MPYTNAEKQKRARDRTKAKMARYEAALREIVRTGNWEHASGLKRIARDALNHTTGE